jgi:hypothetical protein
MSHSHNHGDDCGHEAHQHDHDHDHGDPPGSLGPADNLFGKIDLDNVIALNSEGDARLIIKPWDQRSDEEIYLESDADDQLYV